MYEYLLGSCSYSEQMVSCLSVVFHLDKKGLEVQPHFKPNFFSSELVGFILLVPSLCDFCYKRTVLLPGA